MAVDTSIPRTRRALLAGGVGGLVVFLTPRGNLGGRDLWYTVNATTNEITIRVSSAVTANLQVGWLLLG